MSRRRTSAAALLTATLLGLVMAALSTAQPSTVDEQGVLAAANRSYEQEDFAAAVTGYRELLRAGVRDARVHYNLGNALYRLGRLGPSILAYERALRLSPSDPRIRENLEYVSSLRIDEVSTVDEGVLSAVWRWHGRLPHGALTVVFLLAWVILNGAGALTLFGAGPGVRRIGAYVLVASVVAVLAAAVLLGPLIYRRDAIVRGIVLPERLDLRSVPGAGITLATVHEGLDVRVRGRRGDWLEITLPNGMRGWVARETVGLVAGNS